MPAADKMDRKLKRLRRIEAGYRADIRRAHQTLKLETVNRTKAEARYERTRKKLEGKIEKLQPKIRDLTNRKAEMRS
ncbi:MAG TPA: hypothetical protein VEO20_10615 [Thermoplasmata archaeon]|nr:hypothetical protein [Thermoplasmata archaeon]